VRFFSFSISLLNPYKNCAKMIPEFPRAPTNVASARATAVTLILLVGSDNSIKVLLMKVFSGF